MILHLDMDAFFASVEQRDNPELMGKPIVVSGHSRRSVVSTASYEARKFGIHSAMPVFQAQKRCPDLVIVPGNRHKYAADSKAVMSILKGFSPYVEQVSIDEAFMDISGTGTLFGPPKNLAGLIKDKIRDTLALSCSIGIAPVKFLAKIASDMNKPDGLTLIPPSKMQSFIRDLPIEKVPGVGKQAMKQMGSLQVHTLGDLRSFDARLLTQKFGKMGTRLSQLAMGVDDSPVEVTSVRKSISSETTLDRDISSYDEAKKIILDHCQKVGRDLRRRQWVCRHVSIKIKFSDFTQVTRGRKTHQWISSSRAIYHEALGLYDTLVIKKKIRLIGVGVSDFQNTKTPVQGSLLPNPEEDSEKQWQTVDNAVDSVWKKFGSHLVQKASLRPEQSFNSYTKKGSGMADITAVKVLIQGRVQGVCFRANTREQASGRRLKGYVRNLSDGSVEALFQGPRQDIETMLTWCRQGAPGSRVDQVTPSTITVNPKLSDFRIKY